MECLHDSFHMPLGLLRSMLPELELHHEYIVYCDTGSRAQAAVFFLEQLGYHARALVGGLGNLTDEQRATLLQRSV